MKKYAILIGFGGALLPMSAWAGCYVTDSFCPDDYVLVPRTYGQTDYSQLYRSNRYNDDQQFQPPPPRYYNNDDASVLRRALDTVPDGSFYKPRN
jgi:hypothetical protein